MRMMEYRGSSRHLLCWSILQCLKLFHTSFHFLSFHSNHSKSDARHSSHTLQLVSKTCHILFILFVCHFTSKVSLQLACLLYCNEAPIVLLMYLNTLV